VCGGVTHTNVNNVKCYTECFAIFYPSPGAAVSRGNILVVTILMAIVRVRVLKEPPVCYFPRNFAGKKSITRNSGCGKVSDCTNLLLSFNMTTR